MLLFVLVDHLSRSKFPLVAHTPSSYTATWDTSPTMGNAHSSPTSPSQHNDSRQRSAGTSRIAKSCCTSNDQFQSGGSVDSEDTYCNETHVPKPLREKCASYLPSSENDSSVAYRAFLKAFPEYKLTETLDALRQSDFSRLDRIGETYVDYMGGSVYPESLIRGHANFLNNNVLGNTHSVSNR